MLFTCKNGEILEEGLHHVETGSGSEKRRLIDEIFEPLKERWIALSLFCALTCSQSCIWNTWGPIAESSIEAFPSWSNSTIALLSNWGCITYLTCCLPACWILSRKGLLLPIRLAAILTALATLLRCVSSKENIFTVMVHLAGITNGLSGVIIGPAIASLSAVWFPRGERTTATGISSACNQLGVAASYLVGPAVIGSPYFNDSLFLDKPANFIDQKLSLHQSALKTQIVSFMRVQFIIQLLLTLEILLFFPKEVCHSTAITRFGLLESVISLLKNRNIWRLSLAAGLSQGITGPWFAMMTMTFDTAITQSEADKLALWTVLFSSVLSLTVSRLMDIFQGHLRIAIHILLTTSSVMFLWVLLLNNRILTFHKHQLYMAVTLGISASWSTPALFLELASEIAFPISEAIVGGYLIFLANLIGALFYFCYFLPEMSERWSSYCVFINLTIATILIKHVKDEYHRTATESSIRQNYNDDAR
ncbi:solute carrier family 49 member 4 homolog [Prorops nasuta]|uniref:solute carrier family 49 member 4 homolog n=1 Tax=Prorops nasuta TaxID=863751 RepID=UPI0034CD371E